MEFVNPDLPEELEEKIIALIPFPAIFKARCLSRSWRTKLSFIKPSDDEATKLVKTMFQRQVRDWSNDWGTFCPVALCDGNLTAELFAYDQICRLWRRKALPWIFRGKVDDSLAIEGLLLYGFCRIKEYRTGSFRFEERLCVANIFTGTCKKLPRGPDGSGLLCKKLVVSSMSMETYKVILLREERVEGHIIAAIYDSTLNTWSTRKFVIPAGFNMMNSHIFPVYSAGCLNGIAYMQTNL